MNMRIPLWNGKHLVIGVKLEPSYDEVLLSIMKNCYQDPVSGKMRLDKIAAIKWYRNVCGLGLMEAKKHIDDLAEKNNLLND